jgi:hypothetical protein
MLLAGGAPILERKANPKTNPAGISNTTARPLAL